MKITERDIQHFKQVIGFFSFTQHLKIVFNNGMMIEYYKGKKWRFVGEDSDINDTELSDLLDALFLKYKIK